MIYLIKYKCFESKNIVTEIKEYIDDIFSEIKDDGFEVEVYSRWIRTSEFEEHTGYEVKIKKMFTKFPINTFLLEDVYEYILTCKSYLKENGFFITDVRVSALGVKSSIGLHELNPEKYKLFNKPLINLEFKIRRNK
jgi:hypothetical protein